jgi:hypothetical protein
MENLTLKRNLRILAGIIVILWVIISLPTSSQAGDKYWIGGSSDWNVEGNWSPSGVPVSGDIAYIYQTDPAATDLLTVTYSGTPCYDPPLGQIWMRNSSGSGGPSGSGAGWIMLDETQGAMYTNSVGIGSLGVYKLESGSLTVTTPSDSSSAAALGIGGTITDMDSGAPYKGGLFYQAGGTVQAPILSLGWNSTGTPGMGIYGLLEGSLTVSTDGYTSSGNTVIGNGGKGYFLQGLAPVIPPTGAVYPGTLSWATGSGGKFQTDNLYVGLRQTPDGGKTYYYGKGDYELLYGSLTVNSNAYIGLGGSSTKASQGDFGQGYVQPGTDYKSGVVGDGLSQVLIKGSLYLGLGGSGSYELYNGTLTVRGDINIGFSSYQSGFTQGAPYQNPTTGVWKTSSADGLTSVVNVGSDSTPSNLYIRNGNYTLAYGQLTVTGNTYVGYLGGGNFMQGVAWTDDSSILTPGGTFKTGNLYLGGSEKGTTGNGNYNLANGQLTVNADTYVGYSGWGNFGQGVAWGPNNTYILTGGGTFQTGNLYLGYNSGSNGNYTLADGQLTVNADTHVGYSGWGNFTQGLFWNNTTPVSTPGGTFQTANLYLGYSASINGGYSLANGNLTVTTSTYVGYSGQGNFMQGVAWGPSNTYIVTGGGTFQTGNLYLGYNPDSNGNYTLADGQLTVNGDTHIGYSGWGNFNQGVASGPSSTYILTSGGTFQTGNLYLGYNAGSNGNYNLADGQLTVNSEAHIGYSGQGNFTQGLFWNDTTPVSTPGGTFQTGNLYLGYNAGSNGYYTLANGNLTVTENTYVGYSGWGNFNQGVAWGPSTYIVTGGGTFQTANVYLGYNAGSNGNYTLANGNLTVTENTYVGHSGWGNFNQGLFWNDTTPVSTPGGTFQTGNLYLGYNPSINGYYALANGNLTVRENTYVGHSGWGNFNQGLAWGPSSTYIVTGGGIFQTGNLYLGYNPGSNGNYNLADGKLTVNGDTYVGYSGQGWFNQGLFWNDTTPVSTPGGTFQTGNLYVGGSDKGTTGNGNYNLANGNLTVTKNTYVGYSGQGYFSQTGGTHTVTGTLTIQVNPGSTGTYGTYEMSGGKLNAGNITNYGTFYLKGGDVITSLLQNYGLFKGGGTSASLTTGYVINYGTVSPGSSPGTLTITGNYTQDSSGTLLMELGGLTPGTEYDVLKITGTAMLAGLLNVTLYGGFSPVVGNEFDILQAGGLSETFGSYNLPYGRSYWEVDYDYHNNIVSLEYLGNPPVPVPSTLILLGSGLIGLTGLMRRKFKK